MRFILPLLLITNSVLAGDLKDFANEAHHELEADKWYESINPKGRLLRALRFYNMRSEDPEFGQHAKNLALLLPLSESLEMATGPAITRFTMNHDFHWAIEGLMNIIGWGISIPFVVEPYCLAVIGTYAASTAVQNGTTQLRHWITGKVHQSCEKSGLKRLWNHWFPKRNFLNELQEEGWEVVINLEEPGLATVFYQASESEYVILHLNVQNGQYVESIEVSEMPRKRLKKLLKPLNWSARSLILQGARSSSYRMNYMPREILLKPIHKNCSKLFEAP